MGYHTYNSMGRRLDVTFSYTPEDVSLRINGIQAEPDYAESFEIEAVKLGGVDITDLLSEDLLTDIVTEIRSGK